jgi:NADPH2:quinone reductase
MNTVVISQYGGPEVLKLEEVPTPQPGLHEILVRVVASALNRADILQREGKYPPPPGATAMIPGMEFAGEVVSYAPTSARQDSGSPDVSSGRYGAPKWKPGQRVFGLVAAAAHAEFLVTHQDAVAEIPANLSWSEAAAIPEAYITAHDALWRQAALRAGESVLIHAVGSGVGLAAVELVRAKGAIPYGTSRTADKLDRARKLGMEDGVAVGNDLRAMVERVKQWTHGRGVDVVLDLTGGPYVGASIEASALKARLMLVGTVAGAKAEIPLGMVLSKRLKLIGTVMRTRSLEEKIEATRAFADEVVPLFAAGKLHPVIDSEFPLSEIQAAHRKMQSNETFGKVVLRVAESKD